MLVFANIFSDAWNAVKGAFETAYAIAKFLLDPIGEIVSFVGDALGKALQWLISTVLYYAFSDSLTPDVSSDWFMGVYGKSLTIGLVLVLMGVAMSVIMSITRGRSGFAIRAVVVDLPIAIFGMFFALAIVSSVLVICDEVSAWLLDDAIEQQLQDGLARIYTNTFFLGKSSFWLTLIIGLAMAVGLLTTLALFIVRGAIVYFAVALIPFGYAAYMFPTLRGALRRTVETVAALLLAKPAIAIALVIGAGCIGQIQGPASPEMSAEPFDFLTEGTLTYRGVREVDYVDLILPGGERLRYDDPIRSQGNFSEQLRAQVNRARLESTLNEFMRTTSTVGGRSSTRVFVRGNRIYQRDESCPAEQLFECEIGLLGIDVDPDAEEMYRVVVPTSTGEGLLLRSPEIPAIPNGPEPRRVVFSEEFLMQTIGTTEGALGRSSGQEEITAEEAGFVTEDQRVALLDFFGYEFDAATGDVRQRGSADPAQVCSGDNVTELRRSEGAEQLAGYCATIGLDGRIVVNNKEIGVLLDPAQPADWDFLTMVAGIVIFLMTAIAPFIILRFFPLIESGIALAVLQDYGKSPVARVAAVSFNLGRIARFKNFVTGASRNGGMSTESAREPRPTTPPPGTDRFGSTLERRLGGGSPASPRSTTPRTAPRSSSPSSSSRPSSSGGSRR